MTYGLLSTTLLFNWNLHHFRHKKITHDFLHILQALHNFWLHFFKKYIIGDSLNLNFLAFLFKRNLNSSTFLYFNEAIE